MSDVYSFGVVLLELLTGKRAMDNTRPGREQNLVEWVRPLMKDPRKLERLIDPRLEGQYPVKGAQKAAALAFKCMSHHPKLRPVMSHVVKVLESLQDFQDSVVGPFVYVVPNDKDDNNNEYFGNGKETNSEEEEEKDSGGKNCIKVIMLGDITSKCLCIPYLNPRKSFG